MSENKVRYITHKDVHAEAMKDWRYRFWYYLLWSRYALAGFIWRTWKKDIFPN